MDDILTELKCSYYGTQEHFVEEPLSLDCGHYICKECVLNNLFYTIKCRKCGRVVDRNLKDVKESAMAKKMINLCLSSFYAELEKEMREQIGLFKSLVRTKNETIELKFQFIEEEIEIRIESMKITLNEIEEKFKSDLSDMKQDLQEQQNTFKDDVKIKYYENGLVELQTDLKTKCNQTEENFYSHQSLLKSLKLSADSVEKIFDSLKLKFIPAENMDEHNVGDFVCVAKHTQDSTDIGEILRDSAYEINKTEFDYFDACALPNNQLLLSNGFLHVYDEHFKFVSQIEENATVLANGRENEVFTGNFWHNKNTVCKLDLGFNKIQSLEFVEGTDKLFIKPQSICCDQHYFYVCDNRNQSMHVFNFDLEHVDIVKFEYFPYTVKATSKAIGICGNKGVFFYDSTTRTRKRYYPKINGRMNMFNDKFYVVSYLPKLALYIYDVYGVFMKEISLKRLDEYVSHFLDGLILNTNHSLLLFSYSKKVMLNFKLD